MKFKAAILFECKKPLLIEEISLNPLKEGQVLIKIFETGICRSQIFEIDGERGKDNWLPHLLGHEAIGEVVEVGKSVKKLKIGDKVKVAIPKTDQTIFGNIPRLKTLEVSGIFNLGMYEYDSNFVFLNTSIPRKLLMLEEGSYNKFDVLYNNPNKIEILQSKIEEKIYFINPKLYSLSWKQLNSSLINALNVELFHEKSEKKYKGYVHLFFLIE